MSLPIKPKRWAIFALPVLAVGISTLEFMSVRSSSARQADAPPPVHPSVQTVNLQDDFENVANAMLPSVVSITSRQPVSNTMRVFGNQGPGFAFPNMPGLPGGAPNVRIFPNPGQSNGPQFQQYAVASGSGMIVRSDGYILTNDHVVAGADRVTVTLRDGHKYVGKVFRDPMSDLAVIKINATNLPTVQFENSDDVKVGQWAIAFGSPFDLKDTMTVGIISSLSRQTTIGQGNEMRYYPSLLQTDASINPGNSGGPLVDIYGRVVGVNVAIESPSGGNVGIGFAIPANSAKYIMDQLIENGKVTRGYLGLDPSPLTYADKQRYGVDHGALITAVVDGTPAAKAGFQVQDVVTAFDNKPVKDEVAFRNLVMRTAPGTTVPVEVHRDGNNITLNVTVGNLPNDMNQVSPTVAPQKSKSRLGIGIADLSSQDVRRQLGISPTIQSGAVVEEVYPGSPAEMAGLMAGDVIVSMDGKPITSAQQLSDVAGALPADAKVPVVIRRSIKTPGGGTQVETVLLSVHLVN